MAKRRRRHFPWWFWPLVLPALWATLAVYSIVKHGGW